MLANVCIILMYTHGYSGPVVLFDNSLTFIEYIYIYKYNARYSVVNSRFM